MDENVCRICLQVSNEEEMTSIFDNDENSIIISNKIKSCCGVKLPKESDGLPTKICSKCKIFLTIAYKLRTICQNSDAYLRRFKVKDSEVEENEEMQLKKEKEVTDKLISSEENVDSNSLTSQTSFPETQGGTGEHFFINCSNSNADSELNFQIKKVETLKPYLENLKDEETMVDDQSFKSKPIRLERSLKKKKEQHVKSKEKKYGICPYCGDKYALSSLSLHIRRHTGEKPYKCDTCEKAFVELHDLKRHQRTHTGEKPHVCAICGKAFSQQNKLARHNLVHTGERPYKCDKCDKAFSQRNELNLHIRRHTGDKPYMCGICGESFITGTFLRNHQKSNSHFEEETQDRFIKIRVTNPSRSYRNTGTKRIQVKSEPICKKTEDQ